MQEMLVLKSLLLKLSDKSVQVNDCLSFSFKILLKLFSKVLCTWFCNSFATWNVGILVVTRRHNFILSMLRIIHWRERKEVESCKPKNRGGTL